MNQPRISILCVDDEVHILTTLLRFFRKDPYQILLACNARDAIEALEHEAPVQLIISDFRMPGENGVELLKTVQERWPDTVSILLSGFSDLPTVLSAIEDQHVFRQVSKPWKRQELRDAVNDGLALYEARTSSGTADPGAIVWSDPFSPPPLNGGEQ